MIRVTFLGTSAAAPTISRSLSSIAVKREGDLLLFDCGEGTQRQMMRYGTGFDVQDVFFTHLHADHFLGIIGFVRTLKMADRQEPMHLFGPRSAKRILTQALSLGMQANHFLTEIHELKDGDVVQRNGYQIHAFEVNHRVPALGYALVEPDRPGRFDLEKARALHIPEGPLFGRLQKGQNIILPDGREIFPSQVVGPARSGRKVVISGDTRPCSSTQNAAINADLLIHEATFGDEDIIRANETGHSTARGAALLAKEAQAKRLVLTHISSRYDTDVTSLLQQAREEFARTDCAKDGLQMEVPFAD